MRRHPEDDRAIDLADEGMGARAPRLGVVASSSEGPASYRFVAAALEGELAIASDSSDASEPGDAAASREGGVRRGGWRASRGLVEGVRLIVVALFAVGGWEIANSFTPARTGELLIGIVLGSAVGYVLGGVLGRTTATAVSDLEREFQRVPAADMLAGVFGLLVGLTLATLISVALFHLPPVAAYSAVAFVYPVCGFAGWRIARAKSDDIFSLFGVKPRAAGRDSGEVAILDSSAILDGRLLSLVQMGFLSGTLLITRGVLDELQAVADSSNGGRRARGRKALDLLLALKRDPKVDLMMVADEATSGEATDAALVRLAKERGGTLVTVDHNLARVAEALRVPVAQINSLATKFRTPFTAGDELTVHLVKEGREHGQGVGYLDDGSLVVVESANPHIGSDVTVRVKNVIQTTTGRMIFSSLPEAESEV
jgi:uncharacterized protein YacL